MIPGKGTCPLCLLGLAEQCLKVGGITEIIKIAIGFGQFAFFVGLELNSLVKIF